MPHTREDFYTLMKKFHIPVVIVYDIVDSLDNLHQLYNQDFSLFTGVDSYGRHFLSIPLRAIYADGVNIFKNVLIYQKEPNGNFKVSARLPETETFDMLLRRSPFQVTQELDFLNLAILLAGRSVEIYKRRLVEPKRSPVYDDPDSYVTLSIYDSSTLPVG